jgi:DNA-binding transcriptional regulator YhcF (GntR family)
VIVRIDPGAPDPPFEQLRAQVLASIAAGELPPGTRLPPIRQLAGDLGLAPGTVARAYRELETAGLVVSAGRRGTRVAAPPAGSPVPDARVVAAARRFAAELAPLHLDVEVAVTAVRAAFRHQAADGQTT